MRKKGWLRCEKDRDEEEGKRNLDIGSHNEASKKTDTREVISSLFLIKIVLALLLFLCFHMNYKLSFQDP